eukprot:s7133_g3.t2
MRAASSTDAYVPSPPVPEAMGLLEGGATNPLRTALMDELDHAAMGGTRLWINRTGTLLSDVEVDPMVPMGCLASELRCNVTWEGSLCRVRHPGRGWLDITMIGQCPYVDRSVALDLIQELEISETHKRSSAVGLYRGLDQSMKNTVVAGREDDWLRDLDSAFFGAMASLFSDAPEDKVIEAIGTPSFWVAGGGIPVAGRMPVEMTDDEGVPEADDEGVPEADDAGFLDKEAVDAVPKVAQAQGARVQDDDNDDSFWALSESECLVAWEVAMLVALQGVKGGAWVLGWFRARLCPRRSPTGSYQPHVQTVLAGQHQVQSYRKAASRHIEQERLYGRQLFVSSFGWADGWLDPGTSDRWCFDEASHVLVRFHSLLFHAPAGIVKRFPYVQLTGRRKTWYLYEGHEPDFILDTTECGARKLSQLWTGRTEFQVVRRRP